MRDIIIGLGYKLGVGKDTVANILVRDYGFTVFRFAEALKSAVSAIFSWPRDLLEDQQFKSTVDPFWGLSPRTVLQRLGTEVIRDHFGKDIWINSLKKKLELSDNTHIVIPDVRFLNEIDAIHSWGGSVFNVIRYLPQDTSWTLLLKHASETELDSYTGWDGVLMNTGTLAHLHQLVDKMYDELTATEK